ncbi:hypothetical protein Y1Q_0021112 [Alligator mississippiensis]|uniref:Uncharacterized protein n=1 Tax=Alligator mississippiensis TaxID=8496 RepID=A0A151NRZ1_ALLMI|nr:hypothetical protein Y1Q_0021112 [Alligator mississippiensis]
MGEISVVETDSRTPKTDLGIVADPQQTTAEPQAESLGVADNLNPKDSAEGARFWNCSQTKSSDLMQDCPRERQCSRNTRGTRASSKASSSTH